MTREEQMKIFKAAASSDKDFNDYAASVRIPILESLPVMGTVRNIYATEVLTQDQESKYPVDGDDVVGYLVPTKGGYPREVTEDSEVYVPTFELRASIYYDMDAHETGRFNVGERNVRKLTRAMLIQEEAEGWKNIRAAAINNSAQVITSGAETTLSLAMLTAIAQKFEDIGKKLTDLYVEPKSYSDLRTWTTTTIAAPNRAELLTIKGLEEVWQAKIHTLAPIRHKRNGSKAVVLNRLVNASDTYLNASAYWASGDQTKIAAGTISVVFGLSQMDELGQNSFGVMPIRKDLMTFPDPTAIKHSQVGILAREKIGFMVYDFESIVMATIYRS